MHSNVFVLEVQLLKKLFVYFSVNIISIFVITLEQDFVLMDDLNSLFLLGGHPFHDETGLFGKTSNMASPKCF